MTLGWQKAIGCGDPSGSSETGGKASLLAEFGNAFVYRCKPLRSLQPRLIQAWSPLLAILSGHIQLLHYSLDQKEVAVSLEFLVDCSDNQDQEFPAIVR